MTHATPRATYRFQFHKDFTFADAETLAENPAADRPRRLLAAARMGATRLIDNIAIDAP